MAEQVAQIAKSDGSRNWGLADAALWVRGRVKASRSSFFWAMRTLPKPRREAMFAVYAFCRAVDDIADGPGTNPEKTRALTVWRGEVRDLFQGYRSHRWG